MIVDLTLAAVITSAEPPANLDRYVYPLAPTIKAPEITVDSTAAPDLAPWGDKAKDLCTTWFPLVCQLLSTQGYQPPTTLKFVFRANQDAPAYATRNEISISIEWVRQHPNDLGMMVHEMTHIIQSYPRNRNNAGWLVEGIADYIRWWRYEPEAPRSRIDFSRATFRDSYRTTAAWLAWSAQKYNMSLVPELDKVLRKGEDPLPVFEKVTGKTAQQLWDEFKADSERRAAAAAAPGSGR
jgi:hypothetical protein